METVGSVLSERAAKVAADCEKIARALAFGAERARRRRLLLRSINVVIGALAAAVASIPAVGELVGVSGIKIITAIAALVLILDSVLPVMIGEDTFERLSEYSMYVHAHAGSLLNTLADEGLPVSVKRARLSEVLAMASRNLDDVRSKWPWADASNSGA